MYRELRDVAQEVSTGTLPPPVRIDELIEAAHRRYLPLREGAVADYIPVLAAADPELFGVVVAEVDGDVHDVGDAAVEFTIQSSPRHSSSRWSSRNRGTCTCGSAWASTTPACRSTP